MLNYSHVWGVFKECCVQGAASEDDPRNGHSGGWGPVQQPGGQIQRVPRSRGPRQRAGNHWGGGWVGAY